jgi:hypothetical protein
MTTTKLIAGAMIVSAAAFALPTFAQIYIDKAPPPPRQERYEPRAGYTWVPGVWQWKNNRHDWVPGHYVAERKGHRYERDRWVQHEDNNKWTYQRGGWSQDSDGDGTPDRVDRHPNDPTRR